MQSKIGCYIISVAVITVWSTTFVSTKILLHSLSPEEIMFFDNPYLIYLASGILILPCLLLSVWASARVHKVFGRYSRPPRRVSAPSSVRRIS